MEKTQSADGTTIAFDRTGTGRAVVLVVGAFCDRQTTKALAALLAPDFTVYEYDRRGRGDSSDQASYAPEREIDDLAAVVAATGSAPFVYGHSSGAVLGLEAAAQQVPIRMLAVYEPPYTGADGVASGFADELASLAASGQRGEAAARFLALTGAPAAAIAGMRSAPFWPRMEAIAHTLPYDVRLCGDGTVPAGRLAAIGIPVLALAGGASPDWAYTAAGAVTAAVPHGGMQVLPGQDHGAAAEVVAPVLRGFFA
ncbi:MAG: alpha/beta hydrolase [Actinomycetota bacterium]